MITFYCGLSETVWNHHPVAPGSHTCISPVYGSSEKKQRMTSVRVPADTAIIQDSGAFSDSWATRLSFPAALDRQIAHAERYGYTHQITHRASYDLLIDEVWTDGNRYKRRWSVAEAESAVDETIAAAKYLADNRHGLKLTQSAQGVDAPQYLRCTEQVLDYLQPGDWFGLGGWCIIGKMPKRMLPVFRETLRSVIPYAAKRGVQHVHIWGVIYPFALGELLWMCDQHGITLSTDSAGPSRNPAFGQWGYGNWRDNSYKKPSVETLGLDRARHVAETRDWLQGLRNTHFYAEPMIEKPKPFQLSFLDMVA